MNSSIFWIIVSIATLLVVLGVLAFLFTRKKKRPTNYYAIFILGVCLIPVGIPADNYAISALGLIYMILGLAHRKEWKKNRFSWKKLGNSERILYAVAMGFLIAVLVAGVVVLFIFGTHNSTSKIDACTNSGGQVLTQLCCESSGDFPNTCLIGACGCSPSNSHNVKVCSCPEGKCFDGNSCV